MKHHALFTKLGLEQLSDEEKASLSEDLGEVALDRIATRLEALLTDEQMTAFETKLNTDPAAAFALLREYIPDYPAIAHEEIERLRNEIITTQDAVMKKLKT